LSIVTCVEDFNELSNRPLQVPASEITAGTGTSYRLFNVDNIKALGAWAGIQGKPNNSLKSSTPPPLSKSSATVGFVLII
jgi:hypothetical protein